jgi:hypothetical protein
MKRKVQSRPFAIACAALTLGCSASAIAATDVMVCVTDGVPGPSDPLECDGLGTKSKDKSLATLYKDGWHLVDATVTNKAMTKIATVMFLEKSASGPPD